MTFTQTQRVVTDGEVLIGDYRFRLFNGGPVRPVLINQWPEKITQGDSTRADQRIASEWVISDNRGGLGIEKQIESTQEDRYWFSTARASDRGEITLPFQSIEITGMTNATDYSLVTTRLGVLSNSDGSQTILAQAATGSQVATKYFWQYDSTNNEFGWCSGVSTSEAATDYVDYNGKGYFACGANYYMVAGGVATAGGSAASHFVVYDDFLVKVTSANVISASQDGTTWTEVGTVPPSYHIRGLFTFVDNANAPCIYISTQYGLLLYVYEDSKFYPTPLQVPADSKNGHGACVWNGYSFYSDQGLGVERYAPGVIQSVGMNRDDGLPEAYRGFIKALVPAMTDLYALVQVDAALEFIEPNLTPTVAWGSEVMGAVSGQASVFNYTGTGWHHFYEDTSDNEAIKDIVYTNVFGYPSVALATTTGVQVFRLPYGVSKATRDSQIVYRSSGTFESSWFTAQMPETDKILLSVKVKVSNISSATSVVFMLYYAPSTGGTTAYTLGTVDLASNPASAYAVFSLPEGIVFRELKIVASLASSDSTTTPILEYISLRYARTLNALYGFSCRIDCSRDYNGRSKNEQLNALLALANGKHRIAFAWRDSGEIRDLYVRITQLSGQGSSGTTPEGVYDIVLTELSSDES